MNTTHEDHSDDLRYTVALANRVLVQQGVLDAFGHVSARSAPGEDTFLLSRSLAPASVTRADVMVHGLDGEPEGDRAPYLERFIHGEIYRHRPDVMAIVHSHSAAVLPFCISSYPLRAAFHMAGFLTSRAAPVFEIGNHAGDATDLLVTTPELGAALAATLADRAVVLMRGHGSVTTGSSVRESVARAVYLDANARLQAQAAVLGQPRFLTEEEAAAADVRVQNQVGRAWDVWCSQIDAKGLWSHDG